MENNTYNHEEIYRELESMCVKLGVTINDLYLYLNKVKIIFL